MSIWTRIILGIIVLHLIGGIGWLIYVLAPREEDNHKDDDPTTL